MRKKTILIVDDDMDARLALEKELVAEGYFVFTAYSGNNALCLVRSKCPDLIILDSVLGDMSGKEVAARLKGDPRTNRVPIIFLDALSLAEDEVEMERVVTGENTFAKPYDARKLLATLEEFLFASGAKV